ncbi:autotransporter outer membrane beta-barrel domain-containing protein [Flavobacterium hydrophilum]|uniref:TMF family protein n=1 Tax=Flavobacterium hydrophilum TaxID=2211445 RepID=A0A2V4CL44_9FLAO|nr:hypothetical protein [Flavobacterium hydrophilum]PXY46484.1 hypothetical protein DMB68_04735 [Flavobacterium hydrophilum]
MKLKLLTLTSLFFINSNIINAQNTNTGTDAGNAGTNNSAFGYYAGNVVTGNNNSFFGTNSGLNTTSGSNNVFAGYKSGNTNTTGQKNIFIGSEAGKFNVEGSFNVFFGNQSGYFNTSGVANVFLGYKSGYGNLTGSHNVFSGYGAGTYNTTGRHNIFTGYEAGYLNSTGEYNVIIGDESGYSSNGTGNTFTGRQAGYQNVTGNYNVAMGYKAGYSNSAGSYNIFLGYKAGENETTSNRLYIDNSPTITPLIYGKFDTDQLGINTNIIPTGYTMAVKGKFITEEVKVQTYTNWPDFVFKKEYNLPTLSEVEQHIKENGHLQNIPSASEVSENGILLGEMNAKLLQKIEELTLYIIQQEKRFNDQEARLKKLEAKSK